MKPGLQPVTAITALIYLDALNCPSYLSLSQLIADIQIRLKIGNTVHEPFTKVHMSTSLVQGLESPSLSTSG
jgi:hypothetical protein